MSGEYKSSLIKSNIVGCFWQQRPDSQDTYLPYDKHELHIPLAVFERFIEAMTEKEQLFADFFSKTYTNKTVLEMTIQEIRDWIETDLEKILLEAKATIQAAKQIEREKVAKLSSSEREKLLSNPSLSVSDSLAAVKKRKERKTKADKLYDSMIAAGMDEADARRIAGMLPVDETRKPLAVLPILTDGSHTYQFAGTPTPIDEQGNVEVVKPTTKELIELERIEIKKEADKPFNPSSLFGG